MKPGCWHKNHGQALRAGRAVGLRVILVGDRKQHGAVERSGALRLLETKAGLPVAEVTEIKRQSGPTRRPWRC